MANPLGVWELGTGAVVALATGQALSDSVAPVFEVLSQTAWRNKPTRVLDAPTAALVAAQQLDTRVDLGDDAQRGGVGPARWALYQQLALQAASPAEALSFWRRGEIDQDLFEHSLWKAQLEPEWLQSWLDARIDRLDPAIVANAIQQGFMPNPGILPATVTQTAGKVATLPPVDIDPIAEALASGVDPDRLRILAGLAGLPPGPQEMLEMLRRGIIDESDVERGIAQGHTKTEWAAAYLALAAEIISPATATQLRLRGHIDAEQSYALGSLSGFAPYQMDWLYQASGRPASPGQMATAVARGFATQDDFTTAIVESDIRPEYAPLLYDLRFTYPSLFFTKAAVAAGEVDDATATQWLVWERYPEEVAAKLVASFHKAKTSGVKELTRADILTFYAARYIPTDTAVTDLGNLGYNPDEITLLLEHADAQRILRYLDASLSKIESRYVGWHITRQTAEAEIGSLGVPGSARDEYLGLWDIAREANTPQLSAAQILTLLDHGKIGSQAAHDSLVARGYSDLAAQAEVSRYAAFGAPGSLPGELETPL